MDSALKNYDNYYPRVHLKEFKYIDKKLGRYIIGVLECSSDDTDDSDE